MDQAFLAQALHQPVRTGGGADHPNRTSRQGRHRAVTLAGGAALALVFGVALYAVFTWVWTPTHYIHLMLVTLLAIFELLVFRNIHS